MSVNSDHLNNCPPAWGPILQIHHDSVGDVLNFFFSALSSATRFISRQRSTFGHSDPPTILPSVHLDNPADWFQFDATDPLVCLECAFPETAPLKHLHRLTDIIAQSPALEEVNLHFHQNVFTMEEGTALALREVMCAMAAKNDGPVIFFDDGRNI
ncbi:hypothetical protein C8R43DRAFT_1141494 [Mycena crocata]|nr:hypothetical protein C8R43DRAFT_1141494 [Mycena crocata]